MAKKVKKQAAPLPALRFDFQRAVRKTVKAHPELKKNAVFINVENDEWLGSPSLISGIESDFNAAEQIEKRVKKARKLKTSFCQPVDLDNDKTLDNEKTVYAIIFHSDADILYDPQSRLIEDTGSFDHEVGHALTMDTVNGRLGENTADAYAVIRQLQRFKKNADNTEYCGWNRALIFMKTGSTSHLTTFTTDKILIAEKTVDFLSLSPQETIAIARDYARLHTPKGKQLKKLVDDFKSLRNLPPTCATFKKLARLTLKAPENSLTFHLGTRILSGPLRPGGIVLDGKKIALRGPEWKKLREKLAQKTAKLPATHPLRRLK